MGPFAELALILIFAGLASGSPPCRFIFMHPDVYQGTTNPNAGLLAVVPKIAAVAALVRIALRWPCRGWSELGWQLALALAMVTMTLGNLLALWQTNVRRLMAYSSIAHAGYMLIGLAVGFAVAGGATEADNFDGVGAMLFYLLVYAAATAGTFAALTYLGGRAAAQHGRANWPAWRRTIRRRPPPVAVHVLAHRPAAVGRLLGQVHALHRRAGRRCAQPRSDSSLWPWFLALAIVGAVNAAISAGYYLRIVGVMYFRPPSLGVPRPAAAAEPPGPWPCAPAGGGHRLFPGPAGGGGQPGGRKCAPPSSQPRIVPETASKDAAADPTHALASRYGAAR